MHTHCFTGLVLEFAKQYSEFSSAIRDVSTSSEGIGKIEYRYRS